MHAPATPTWDLPPESGPDRRLAVAPPGPAVAGRYVMMPRGEPPAVARARALVDARLGDELHLRDVARHAGMSKYHFCRVFKATTGLTFNSYVVQARVTRAQQRLLDPQARVSEVAYEVGFQSLSQFNRHFRRLVGECPTRFRAHCQPANPAFSP